MIGIIITIIKIILFLGDHGPLSMSGALLCFFYLVKSQTAKSGLTAQGLPK